MHPPVFSDFSFDDALAKAKGDGKLLLVDATASWCQPCKHMDKTTWVDGNVVVAIGKDGLAIQFDVDEQKDLMKKLGVRAMPTVIAFRDGKEIDRIVGMRAPAAFVAWLEGLARGETSLDLARTAAREKPTSAERARPSRAGCSKQASSTRRRPSTSGSGSTWSSSVPQFAGMKHTFFLKQVMELMTAHAPAHEAFARLRDAAEPGTLDWFSLNPR